MLPVSLNLFTIKVIQQSDFKHSLRREGTPIKNIEKNFIYLPLIVQFITNDEFLSCITPMIYSM